MFFPNVTIDVTRNGATVYWSRRAQCDFPTRQERIISQGAEVPLLLYDAVDADYREGDTVELLSIDGHTVDERPAKYSVGQVERLSAPLALTSVELRGLGGYQS